MKFIFGPVPSRRLGISLGIDLVPHKYCTHDCVYCECGKTTNKISKRSEFYPLNSIIAEINSVLSNKPKLNYITFSGSGEPTLSKHLGVVVQYLKKYYPEYKVALITNSALLHRKGLIGEIQEVDLIIPSLDAVSEEVFKKINRSHKSISSRMIINGLFKLKKYFKNKIWLEIFIVPELNNTPAELKKIKQAIDKIRPNKIQINSLDRPSTEKWVKSLSNNDIAEIKEILACDNLEFIAYQNFNNQDNIGPVQNEQVIIDTIARRPCTITDICRFTGISKNSVSIFLKTKIKEGKVSVQTLPRGVFYTFKQRI